MEDFKMENTKNYVVAEVGYEALFEAMIAQAEADMEKENLAQDARQGLADWLKVLKVLDIADAVIG